MVTTDKSRNRFEHSISYVGASGRQHVQRFQKHIIWYQFKIQYSQELKDNLQFCIVMSEIIVILMTNDFFLTRLLRILKN